MIGEHRILIFGYDESTFSDSKRAYVRCYCKWYVFILLVVKSR